MKEPEIGNNCDNTKENGINEEHEFHITCPECGNDITELLEKTINERVKDILSKRGRKRKDRRTLSKKAGAVISRKRRESIKNGTHLSRSEKWEKAREDEGKRKEITNTYNLIRSVLAEKRLSEMEAKAKELKSDNLVMTAHRNGTKVQVYSSCDDLKQKIEKNDIKRKHEFYSSVYHYENGRKITVLYKIMQDVLHSSVWITGDADIADEYEDAAPYFTPKRLRKESKEDKNDAEQNQ